VWCFLRVRTNRDDPAMKYILLWALGIPLPILLIIYLLFR
jgi:hypothetical protein